MWNRFAGRLPRFGPLASFRAGDAYPAGDGGQITNTELPRGWIDGLILSNNGTDADHDIDIAAGEARDGSDAANMALSSALTKQIDASWAVGTNQGGLDGTESVAGTPDADTWYHVWLIRRSDTGVVDVLFSESATAPTMPTNYDQKRRIGAVLTDASANIIQFTQFGDRFVWHETPQDHAGASPTTDTNLTLTVPTGIEALADVYYDGNDSGAIQSFAILYRTTGPAIVPSATLYNASTQSSGGGNQHGASKLNILADTSGQIRWRATAAAVVSIQTLGWIDPRGRNA